MSEISEERLAECKTWFVNFCFQHDLPEAEVSELVMLQFWSEIRRLRAENAELKAELRQSVKLEFVGRAKPMPFHFADEDQ